MKNMRNTMVKATPLALQQPTRPHKLALQRQEGSTVPKIFTTWTVARVAEYRTIFS